MIAAAFLVMLAWTWLTWPDAIYDFGSQLYFPWQITQGRRLYLDIAYFNGPLSQYINALAFAIFGVSLRTLVWLNLLVLAATIALVYRLLARLSGAVAATAAALVFIFVFAFSQYVGIGNYNWVCPYTHEVTHGVALALAAIAALDRCHRSGRLKWGVVAGALLGLVFLTKAEIFLPSAAAMLIGIFFSPLPTGRARSIILVGAAAFAPVAVTFLLLITTMPAAIAGRAILGSWPWLFDHRIAALQFYRQGLGIDDAANNLLRLAAAALVYLVAMAILYTAARASGTKRILALIIVAALAVVLLVQWHLLIQIARPWPLFMLALSAAAIRRTRRRLGRSDRLRAMLAVFAFALLGKMLLNARIAQYGFALAMPAAMLLVEAAVGSGPRWIAARGGSAAVARGGALLFITCAVAVHLHVCRLWIDEKTLTVGDGRDRFLAGEPRGVEVERARSAIETIAAPGSTLAVMPQGLMLNYLTRRTNPLPLPNLMPPELLTAGEERLLTALAERPPDVIVLSLKDIGQRGFILTEGRYEYGEGTLAWVKKHYEIVGDLKLPGGEQPELRLRFLRRRH